MKNFFPYISGELYCEAVKVADIARRVGTPAYVYSKGSMREAFGEFDSAFAGIDHLICYSLKANSNLSVCRIFLDAGSGIDCNSGGELYRALKASADPHKIIFTGVGKTEEEIRMVLGLPVMMSKAESLQELHLINEIAGTMNVKAPIGIRINPDVDPKTHPYISTGLAENKFGIDSSQALEAFELATSLPNLHIVGIDMHIGSQITEINPIVEACSKLAELAATLRQRGISLEHFDIGGGLAASYNGDSHASPHDLAAHLLPILKKTECKILFEPGRYIVGNAGILLTKVLYTKKHKKKNFIIVDAGMNDLIRPTLYEAYHHIWPVKPRPST